MAENSKSKAETSSALNASERGEMPLEDEENDNVVTMVDVLNEEQELEDSAFAVLAGSDDKNCTYNLGYLNRQALYACKTCKTKDSRPAGICLACSLECHEGHEVYELYTKRNFRCDCGNDLFPDNKCKLCANKKPTNDDNKYDHNFFGRYCICDRPYPDVENDDDDQMIQCVVCEDWFHGRHLGGALPENDEFAELICDSCMKRLSFLWFYYTASNSSPNQEEKEIEVTRPATSALCDSDSGFESSCDSVSATSCKLEKLRKNKNVSQMTGPTFWDEDWRSELCKCIHCLAMYDQQCCSFLTNEEDTVHYYESQGKERNIKISQYERGLKEINKIDRVKSIEAIEECNAMTNELKDYLKKFAENKKVVRQEDIMEFFEGLKARKRQKVSIPYTCR
ncbi:putative E3 ubiquitin-protein ligase UBR7-like protein [Dinothrombium tinctorium]|uniref:Putative E3 ubiquitin-protein ligase UBR7-like protein n=1 Tax=Dinothrombium tinctorium TaxID=1965070 RepID=A0A443RMH0_9ACAR|nr:putative E3 ubiquitin-protein ligase UBR7-like protein [Dinothrombium tinctorium]